MNAYEFKSKGDRFFNAFTDDLREAGLLTLVFIVVDYLAIDAAVAHHSVSHLVVAGGVIILTAGYFIDWVRP